MVLARVAGGSAPLRLYGALGAPASDALMLGEHTVLHRAGRWVVQRATQSAKTDFLLEFEPDVLALTAMALAPNRKYVALCEDLGRGKAPQVRLLHLPSRRSVCVCKAAVEGVFVGCAFSGDSKHVVAYTSAPDQTAVVWLWSEQRPVGLHRSRAPLTRVRFNPSTTTLLSLSGPVQDRTWCTASPCTFPSVRC